MVTNNVIYVGDREPKRKAFPHFLHFALTVLSGGLWLPVWVLHRLFSDR
jgi:hypothetical protein